MALRNRAKIDFSGKALSEWKGLQRSVIVQIIQS